jgi:hypothetical protein
MVQLVATPIDTTGDGIAESLSLDTNLDGNCDEIRQVKVGAIREGEVAADSDNTGSGQFTAI